MAFLSGMWRRHRIVAASLLLSLWDEATLIMKTAQEWANEINEATRVPKDMIEEATHNPVGLAYIRAIQRDALIEGLRRYAWWRDGTQYVGTCGTTLAKAIDDVRKEFFP
jgi:hypothetical protein